MIRALLVPFLSVRASLAALFLGFALLLGALPAHAQCEAYDNAVFAGDLDAVDQSFDEVDLAGVRTRLKAMSRRIPCIQSVVDASLLARFGRQMSLASFFSQDEDSVVRWARLAEVADPSLPWGEAFGRGHPWRDMAEAASTPPKAGPEGMRLAVPKKGAVFMDGHLLLDAQAAVEVPHLMQVFDGQGRFVTGWWQDGAAFPKQILSEGSGRPRAPRWYEGADAPAPSGGGGGGGGFKIPVVPMAVAGGLLLGAGGMYAGASMTAGSLDQATNTDELKAKRSTANALVVGSTVAAGAAVGVGVTGVLISANGLGVRLRF